MQHYFVTAENIDDVREEITALDQRAEIEVGCETWSITYQPGNQGGWMTVWPHNGRAAVCLGGDSIYGDWDPNVRTVITDDVDADGNPIVYDENGDIVEADPDCTA